MPIPSPNSNPDSLSSFVPPFLSPLSFPCPSVPNPSDPLLTSY